MGEEGSSVDAVQELRSVVRDLRAELDNAFRNLENKLGDIGERGFKDKGTHKYVHPVSSVCYPFFNRNPVQRCSEARVSSSLL